MSSGKYIKIIYLFNNFLMISIFKIIIVNVNLILLCFILMYHLYLFICNVLLNVLKY